MKTATQKSGFLHSSGQSKQTAATHYDHEFDSKKTTAVSVFSTKSRSLKKTRVELQSESTQNSSTKIPKQIQEEIKLLGERAKVRLFELRQKGTGVKVAFNIVEEESLNMLKARCIKLFDTSRLEAEYDYDTDEEQAQRCKRVMHEELKAAVDFLVTDDPLKLIDNLLSWALLSAFLYVKT